MLRIFDNVNQLRQDVILRRIQPLDGDAVVNTYSVDVINDNGAKLGDRNYVGIGSVLSDLQIVFILSTPATASEFASIERKVQAIKTAKAIPLWATWSQTDWDTFFNANLSATQVNTVSTTAQIRVMLNKQNLVIQNLVKLVIALRDQTWPDL